MVSEGGDSLDEAMFSAAYEELRRIAHKLKRGPWHPTLNPTALVHEAYLKLAGSRRFRAESPEHLISTVIRAMRFILVDAARRQAAASRGGPDAPSRTVRVDAVAIEAPVTDPTDVLAVAIALDELTIEHPLAARAFELQFFGGLSLGEIAGLMAVSEKKVQRLLRLARASLAVALSNGRRASVKDS
jgi:RNA polymerase sigma factor (TIGR02999 family)